MIVITSLETDRTWFVMPGDRFHLSIKNQNGLDEIICEDITYTGIIDYVASFRFTRENGCCVGFNLCGFFGQKDNLPTEMKSAVMVNDLLDFQLRNFKKTCGIIA